MLWGPSRHLGSLTAANWVSFDFNVSYSSCWGYSLINTFKLKKNWSETVEKDDSFLSCLAVVEHHVNIQGCPGSMLPSTTYIAALETHLYNILHTLQPHSPVPTLSPFREQTNEPFLFAFFSDARKLSIMSTFKVALLLLSRPLLAFLKAAATCLHSICMYSFWRLLQQQLHASIWFACALFGEQWMGGARVGKVKKSSTSRVVDHQRDFFAQARTHLTPAFSGPGPRAESSELTPGHFHPLETVMLSLEESEKPSSHNFSWTICAACWHCHMS